MPIDIDKFKQVICCRRCGATWVMIYDIGGQVIDSWEVEENRKKDSYIEKIQT